MSRNDWESGEIMLPRAAIVPIRRELVKRNNEHAEKALALAKKVWNEASAKQKKDPWHFLNRLAEVAGTPRSAVGYPTVREPNSLTDRAADILGAGNIHGTPRPPQKQNTGMLGATTTEFRAGVATAVFDSATGKLTWDTGEGNNAVDRAHKSWLGETLFAELGKVKWTRGTGGWFTGNDEYNQEHREEGFGGNYVTRAIGPVGAENHPDRVDPFTKSDGTHVSKEMISGMIRQHWAKQARAEAQFARAMAGGSIRRKTPAKSTAGSFASKQNDAPTSYLR